MENTTPRYIHSPADLITSRQATRDGFLAYALARAEKAAVYVQKARELRAILQSVETTDELLNLAENRDDLHDYLIAAAGFSDKARQHLYQSGELETTLKHAIDTIVAQSTVTFREEIVYRYLLTRGDTLGGEMRNWAGSMAARSFIEALQNALDNRITAIGTSPRSGKVQYIAWEHRLLVFDVTPRPILNNNIDLILLHKTDPQANRKQLLAQTENYVACGELKGGIDPAGADEHWKTAISALDRIMQSFGKLGIHRPHLFFAGFAIETAMAHEMFTRLQDGRLSYAANLTVPEQVADLATWLIQL